MGRIVRRCEPYNTNMKFASLAAVLMVSTVGFAQVTGSQAAKMVEGHIFDPTRDAAKDLAAGVKKAAKENKRVLVDVGGNWCGWCLKLDKLFHENADIAGLLKKHYVIVKINFSPENENKKVLAQFPKVEAFPHLFVLDAKGKLVHSQDTGLLEEGDHHDPAKVVTFLKKWAVK